MMKNLTDNLSKFAKHFAGLLFITISFVAFCNAQEVLTKKSAESTADFVNRLLPPKSELAHKIVSGNFCGTDGNIVVLFRRVDATSNYIGWVLVPFENSTDKFQKIILPPMDEIKDYFDISVNAVLFANADADAENEMIVIYDYHRTGSTSDDGNAGYIYDWNGQNFVVLKDASQKLVGLKTAEDVRKELKKMTIVKKNLALPKAADVAKIELSNTSAIHWYKSNELLEFLPAFVATEGTYTDKQPFQRGTFVLKNGQKITWLANGKDSILLYEGSNEQLFVLPKKTKTLFPIFDKIGKEGFIDVTGKIVITPQFNKVMEFSEGLALVLIGDKLGYINEKGKIVIAPRWKPQLGFSLHDSQFHEGLAAVVESIKGYSSDYYDSYLYECGYINPKGEYVIKPKFRLSCGIFSEGLAKVEVDPTGNEYNKSKGGIGFIDTRGNWAIKPQFIRASDFSGGFASAMSLDNPQAMIERSFYLVDKTGRKVTDKKDCKWRYNFGDGLAFIYPDRFINEQCEEVFKLPSDIKTTDSTLYFSEGLAYVSKEINGEQRFGYLDRTGKVAIDFIFTKASAFSDGLANVSIKENGNDYNAYINPKGEIVLKNIDSTAEFKNGLAYNWLYTWTISERPNQRNIYGYMNKQGKYVWLSPGAENYLEKNWIEENYVGPQVFDKK